MYDNIGFSERLDIAINKIGGVGKACSASGITYPTLTRWKEGTSDPKMSNIAAFAKAANVTLDWLMLGIDGQNPITKTDPNLDLDEYVLIPAYDDLEVSAGHGSFTEGLAEPSRHLAFRKKWVQARGLEVKYLSVLFPKGDSMTPTIPETAGIVVNSLPTKAFDGKIHVIRIDKRLFVKRTQWLPTGGLRLISDNKAVYDPIDITKQSLELDDIQVCGQVVHVSYDL